MTNQEDKNLKDEGTEEITNSTEIPQADLDNNLTESITETAEEAVVTATDSALPATEAVTETVAAAVATASDSALPEAPISPPDGSLPDFPTTMDSPTAPTQAVDGVELPFNQADNTKPPKKSKAPVIAAVVIASLLFVGIVGFFLLKGPLSVFMTKRRMEKDPSAGLTEVMDNTKANIDATPSNVPDMEQFYDKSLDQQLDFSIAQMPDSYYFSSSALAGSSFSFRTRSDIDSRVSAFDFAMETPYLTMENTQFYISPDLLAVSVPTFYNKHEYITVNTKTFTSDLKNSDFSYMLDLPADFDLNVYLNNYFDNMKKSTELRETSDGIKNEFSTRSGKIVEDLKDLSEIKFLGEEKEQFKFEIIARGRDIEDAIDSYATLINDTAYSAFKTIYSTANSNLPDDLYSQMTTGFMENIVSFTDALKTITIRDDAQITLLVNKKTLEVSEIEIDRLHFETEYRSDLEVSALIVFTGKEHLMDAMTIDINAKSLEADDPEDYRVRISREAPSGDNLVGARWEIVTDIKEINSTDTITLFTDFSWDKKSTSTDSNMSLKLGAKSRMNEQNFYVTLRGNLDEKDGSLLFSKGKFSVMEGSTELLSLFVDYSLNVMETGSISPVSNNSINIFDVDWETVMDNVSDKLDF